MTTTASGVPDLLLRFLSTPFSTTITVAGAKVMVHSNADLASISRHQSPSDHRLETLTATLVCDSEATDDGSDITVIKAWPVASVSVGSRTVLALDCERQEIVGFLAPSVSPTHFVDELLPMVIKLYRELKSHSNLQSDQQRL